jgi:23S rRNA U2552 (ribose-2'-O)-methylase RlmE/FtsJ
MPRWADAATATAAASGFAARSALKLLSLSGSFPQLLPRGASVLDLGCSPGAFLQVAAEKVGEVDVSKLKKQRSGRSLSAAASSAAAAPVFTRVADVFDLTPQTLSALFREALEKEAGEEDEKRKKAKMKSGFFHFDVVLSDLCHSTLGVRSADAARSLDLARAAARLALGGGEGGDEEDDEFFSPRSSSSSKKGVLAKGGSFLVKILEGQETPAFASSLKPCFESIKWARPPATRSKSTEVYLLGLGRK